MSEITAKKKAEVVDLKSKGQLKQLSPPELLHHAISSGASPDILEKMMDLQDRWETKEAKRAFLESIRHAREEFPPILKNNTVDFKSKGSGHRVNYQYEDLPSLCEAIDPVLSKYGLTYAWQTDYHNNMVVVACIITNDLGHSEKSTLCAPPDTGGGKNPVQAVASTVTFLQRYTLRAVAGICVGKDTDGRHEMQDTPHIAVEGSKNGVNRNISGEIFSAINNAGSLAELDAAQTDRAADIAGLPVDWQHEINTHFTNKRAELAQHSAPSPLLSELLGDIDACGCQTMLSEFGHDDRISQLDDGDRQTLRRAFSQRKNQLNQEIENEPQQ